MRPVTDAPLHRRHLAIHAALAALAALALGGCSRDLDVPAPPTSPTITGLSPAKAYAGQLVFVSGEHLEPDATANTLNFAHASARGERWDGSRLVVRVPADAGDGPVTASNRDGTSEPFGDFDYQGLGEPRRVQVASASPILQRPVAVYAVGGDVLLDSTLYGSGPDPLGTYSGLLWAGNSSLATPSLERSAADPTRNLVYYAYEDPSLGPQLVAMDATTGDLTGPVTLSVLPMQLLALPAEGVVLTFHDDGADVVTVTAWSSTLARVGDPATFGAEFFEGAADAGGGTVVVAASDPSDSYARMIAVVGVAPILAGTPVTATPLTCDPLVVGRDCPLSFGTATSSGLVPLAVGKTLIGGFAAVALDDGDVAIASLSSGAFTGVLETWSPTGIESIVGGTASGVALATKPGDDLSIMFRLDPPELVGSVPGSAPWTASADGDLAFVANAGDNDVAVVSLATQARVGRVNFDVRPGADGYAGAAAFVPSAGGVDGNVFFPSTAFPGLLRYDTYTGDPAGVSRTAGIAMLAAAPDSASVWAIVGSPPGVVGYLDGAWDVPLPASLPAAPQRAAASGHLLVVAHDGGLSLIDGGATPATVVTATIDGAASPRFLGVGFTSDGDVWAVVERNDPSDVEAQRWSWDSTAGPLRIASRWTVPGSLDDLLADPPVERSAAVSAAAWLEDGLWIFWSDAEHLRHATLADGTPTGRAVAAGANLTVVDAVSPNGRLLVVREQDPDIAGFPLRFFRADPAAGFPEVRSLVFEERVEGFAFDATGERLYVLTQLPDRIITVD